MTRTTSKPSAPRRAGTYADERYRSALESWRWRARRPLMNVLVPLNIALLALATWRDGRLWWLFAGAILGGSAMTVSLIDDLAPGHILRWRQGAIGERATAKALRPLDRDGWDVRHDLQERYGNIDHLLSGPAGVFVIETKNLSGRISVEDGDLVTRQIDDERDVFRVTTLRSRILGQAADVKHHVHETSGVRTWVQAVVVIWGDFAQRVVETEKLAYVHGDEIVRWLRARPHARVQLALADL